MARSHAIHNPGHSVAARGCHRLLEFSHGQAGELGNGGGTVPGGIPAAATAARTGRYLAVSVELTTPVLLVLGLAARPVALILLGMITVIQLFVYPLAWPTHIQWAAMLLVLLARGGGALSVDWLIHRRLMDASEH
ncbi:Hypothetical protein H16_A1834 [Cupriavidus necator H16]|uniref:DoxX family protein n=1 Tax=Cupriavidus necator (strain ATCC 17699 / DSM 428 / KCTC 22496 / NCIMB 10442 / H16 / Stanier 337) TaxID=381666 RepID=Q0KAN4_CUPNH|nr:Hypothetical protein H16_A1834 [Cupriavidus necator H16]